MSVYYVEKENLQLSKYGMEFFIQSAADPKFAVSPHIHPAIELLFFIKGSFRVCTDNEEIMLGEGDAVLFRSNQLHRVYSLGQDGLYYVIKFSPAFIMQLGGNEFGASYLLGLTLRLDRPTPVWRKAECDRIGLTDAVHALMNEFESTDFCAELGKKVSAAQVLLILLRSVGAASDELRLNPQLAYKIYDTIAYMEQHYSEDISAEECALRADISYCYFSRKFKDLTGKSFKQYLTSVRINHAEKELRSTDKPVTQVALECGFNNIAYFSAIYKKETGVSPSSVRD